MPFLLKQNLSTATPAGPFILSSDGFTIDNNVTSTQIDFRIWKNGALSSFNLTTGAWSTVPANGMYAHTFTTGNVDTIGNVRFYYYTTGRLPVWHDYEVESSNVYDFRNGTSAPGTPTDVWAATVRILTSAAAIWTETTRSVTGVPASTWGASDVWGYATRILTSAAAVWTETTRIVTGVPVSTWGPTDVWAAAARTLTSAGVVWSDLLETTLTFKQGMQGLVAVNLGQSTGGGTTAVSFRNIGSTVTRAAFTVTTVGNRSEPVFSW